MRTMLLSVCLAMFAFPASADECFTVTMTNTNPLSG
jgi:hypothetical protein